MAKITRETSRGFAVSEAASSSMTNTTAETSLFSQSIVGGRMGLSKELRFTILCSLTTGVVPPSMTIRVKFGSSTLVVMNALALASSTTSKPFVIEGVIANKNSASAQYIFAKIMQYANAVPILSSTGAAIEDADWTENTATDKTFEVTAQFGGLSATTTLTFKLASLEMT